MSQCDFSVSGARGAEQTAPWQGLLCFPRPQSCIRPIRELLLQSRWPIERKQALTNLVNARCRPRQGFPFASRNNHL